MIQGWLNRQAVVREIFSLQVTAEKERQHRMRLLLKSVNVAGPLPRQRKESLLTSTQLSRNVYTALMQEQDETGKD